MGKGGAIRWTPEQLAAFKSRTGKPLDMAVKPAAALPAANPMGDFYALGRLAKGRMNKTESAYAAILEAHKHDGTIIDWKFHVLRVRLADNTFYEPDFLVMTAERELQIHECKGSFTTEKGQMKVKLCAEVLPWFRVFKCSLQKDGQWTKQEFNK